MTRKALFIAAAVLLALGPVLAGCGEKGDSESKPVTSRATDRTEEQGDSAKAQPGRTVTMNGRSVMGGWMEHWGFTWEGPVQKNGYLIDYKELNADDMAASFAENTGGLAPGSITFFKFCFADFDGSNLSRREREVEDVIRTAKDRRLRLIIGNALPVRRSDGNPEMLEEYRRFNEFLQRKDRESGDVWVYDFYGTLAGGDGWLKQKYQTEDSHPNDEAYTDLDPSFFQLLDAVYRGQEP